MLYVLNIISHIFCVLQKKIYKQDVLRPKVIVFAHKIGQHVHAETHDVPMQKSFTVL